MSIILVIIWHNSLEINVLKLIIEIIKNWSKNSLKFFKKVLSDVQPEIWPKQLHQIWSKLGKNEIWLNIIPEN